MNLEQTEGQIIGNREMDILQIERGPRDEKMEDRGKGDERRTKTCYVHVTDPIMNVIIMCCKDVPIKINSERDADSQALESEAPGEPHNLVMSPIDSPAPRLWRWQEESPGWAQSWRDEQTTGLRQVLR